ncbi:deoxynucleoside triphosphate triphosphohydrolase SAMHD1 homolog [Cyclospora cayetanensis]|uniref:Deoxynucleoside triphosphate triphosphohydrolase SAMHD1 homolog n=1 Tax=Cyclospora cayetanensis TaxID=88456 RepID=A0A6P6S0U4_9EIME|nr:deoxynucleoside triphosphate triphosphohydrolase SAMHD1 homolog [Cyclospora cayetanensis]
MPCEDFAASLWGGSGCLWRRRPPWAAYAGLGGGNGAGSSSLYRACQEVRRLTQCVEIAGLCHDVGHGPFSHSFEADFINQLRGHLPGAPYAHDACAGTDAGGLSGSFSPADHVAPKWCHEWMSKEMVDRLLGDIIDRGGQTEFEVADIQVIKTMIEGVDPKWKGPPSWEPIDALTRAAFDIVANKRTGLDVDRLDYLCRDSSLLPPQNSLPSPSPMRLLMHSRVIGGEICFNVSELHAVFGVFYTRYSLFNLVYLHKKVRAIELMIAEALREADPVFLWSEAVHDVDEFLTLTDEGLLRDILRHPVITGRQPLASSSLTTDHFEALQRANVLLRKVTHGRKSGDLYRVVSTANFGHDRNMAEIRDVCTPELIARLSHGKVHAEDIVLDCRAKKCAKLFKRLKYQKAAMDTSMCPFDTDAI